ncbi:MAG: alpha/beta fold hydrolase, partial [Nitrospirae bacterium]|nr:alpha/beta fold hydrolase [Nitrospirota bacterium]
MNINLYLLFFLLLIVPYGCYSLYINYALSKSIKRLDIDSATGLIKGIGPFEFRKGDTGVLLIHGYTGTSREMLPLGRYLAERNISSYCILLPGHGSTPMKLKKATKEAWYKAAEKEFLRIKEEYKSVYIVGFSLGSAIAIRLAANYQVDGIALLSPAVYLKKKEKDMLSVENQIKLLNLFFFYSYIKKPHPPDIKDPSVDENNPFYEFYPVNTLKHLIDTMREGRELLPKITCPILIIQSKGDIDL